MFSFKKKNNKDNKDKEKKSSKKKSKEKKSWSKKERGLVIAVFIFTVGASAILGLSARNWKLPGIPSLNPKSINLNIFKEKTIVIEGDKKANRVINMFKEKTNQVSGVWGLYVIDLKTSNFYGYNEDNSFQAASLIKLPVMVAMYQEAENGNLDLESIYELKEADKVEGAGILYDKPEGTKITYRRLIELMAQNSDNTAFKISVGLLGEEKVEEKIMEFGMDKTSYAENKTSPKDMGRLLYKIESGQLISEKNKNELFDFLTNTSFENLIPQGVPAGVRVAHKYGSEVGVKNDAGIVFSEDPFILVIVSEGIVEDEVGDLFIELTRVVYEAQN
jgi:beta-lactamase class A